MINLKNGVVSILVSAVLSLSAITFSSQAVSAPAAVLISFWDAHDENNATEIDHSSWQALLDQYLISPHSSGINRFDYGKVSTKDKAKLGKYIETLTSLDPREYSRKEQKAYWINLYNALTVELVVKSYPAETITDLGKGFFSFGPWDDAITKIQGKEITLNNIEHGVLRPIYQDNRIHYAVNCASHGCPNLSKHAFTAKNTESLLENAAHEYVNHRRGVHFDDDKLVVSSIFHWYKVDFGNSDKTLLVHLQKYATDDLKKRLMGYSGDIDHGYNWSLNKP